VSRRDGLGVWPAWPSWQGGRVKQIPIAQNREWMGDDIRRASGSPILFGVIGRKTGATGFEVSVPRPVLLPPRLEAFRQGT
jgi:hypothetical protein